MHGRRELLQLLLGRTGGEDAGASGSGSGGASGSGSGEAAPSGAALDAYMQSSKEDLKAREAKVGAWCRCRLLLLLASLPLPL